MTSTYLSVLEDVSHRRVALDLSGEIPGVSEILEILLFSKAILLRTQLVDIRKKLNRLRHLGLKDFVHLCVKPPTYVESAAEHWNATEVAGVEWVPPALQSLQSPSSR
jgi:hypothetical protein